MDSIKEYETELTRIYDRLNKEYWSCELPEVMLLISDQKGVKKYGDIETNPHWTNGDKEQGKYIIHIYTNVLKQGEEKLLETILHEQCHLYAMINNIEDCTYQYHNKKFKKIAEEHHLIVNQISRYGFGSTELDEEAKKLIKKMKIKKFNYLPSNKLTTGPLKTKMICPVCRVTNAYVSSTQNLICGFCNKNLIVETKK